MKKSFSGVLSDLDRVLISAESIRERVSAMATDISVTYAGKTITVVALMDGALFFVADLLRQVDLPIRLITLSASSYHGGTQSSGEVRVNWPDLSDLAGQDVLLLDDILDTGLTLDMLKTHLIEQQPASLRVGILLEKKRERTADVTVDFLGFEIEDEFVVGYGMDYQGRFRNLPCIGILNPDSDS